MYSSRVSRVKDAMSSSVQNSGLIDRILAIDRGSPSLLSEGVTQAETGPVFVFPAASALLVALILVDLMQHPVAHYALCSEAASVSDWSPWT